MQAKATEMLVRDKRGICPPVISRTSTTNLRTDRSAVRGINVSAVACFYSYRHLDISFNRDWSVRPDTPASLDCGISGWRDFVLPVILGRQGLGYLHALHHRHWPNDDGCALDYLTGGRIENAFSHLRLNWLFSFLPRLAGAGSSHISSRRRSFAARFVSGPIPFMA